MTTWRKRQFLDWPLRLSAPNKSVDEGRLATRPFPRQTAGRVQKGDSNVMSGRLNFFLLAAVFVAVFSADARAADPAAKNQAYKQWTLTCATPAAAQGSTAKQQPFCLIHHEVHLETDQTKTIMIATTRFIGKERTLA